MSASNSVIQEEVDEESKEDIFENGSNMDDSTTHMINDKFRKGAKLRRRLS